VENYLPAHGLCNGYKWAYSQEEFQWVLKIGVWARHQMERHSALGEAMLHGFFDYECRREARRVKSTAAAPDTPTRPARRR
jgi:hypothetical protein